MSLFAEFDAAELAVIRADVERDREAQGRARAMKRQGRVTTRRAKSEAVLAEVMPQSIEPGESVHVISHGDVDSLSYLRHLLRDQAFDECLVSTWCMARPDIEELRTWLAAGKITTLEWYVGEIFPSQYPDEHELVQRTVVEYGGRCCVARNHSKMIAARGPGGHYVVESSANINTNPRIEQAVVTHCEDLYWFVRDFFDGLKSIARG